MYGFGLGLGHRAVARQRPAWVAPGAVLDLHLQGRRYWLANREVALPATTARAGSAWAFDTAGVLQEFEANQPRILPGLGLTVEAASTNYAPSSDMTGAGVGVIGSGGTYPTGTQIYAGGGITAEIISLFTQNGMKFMRLRFTGTNNSGGVSYAGFAFPMSGSGPAAASGEKWSASAFIQVRSDLGTQFSGLSSNRISLQLQGRAGSAWKENSTTNITDTNFSRREVSRTLNNAATDNTSGLVDVTTPNTNTIDIYIDVAIPQLEKQSFISSPIVHSSTSATRAADVFTMADVSWLQDDMTWVTEWDGVAQSGADRSFWVLDDATSGNEIITSMLAGGAINSASTTGGVGGGGWQSPNGSNDDSARHKLAVSYDQSAGTYRWSLDGAVMVQDTGNTIVAASVVTQAGIGHRRLAELLNGRLLRLIAIPGFKTASELEALSS